MAEARIQVIPMSDRQVIAVLKDIGVSAREESSVTISWDLLGVAHESHQLKTMTESETLNKILSQDGTVLSRAWVSISEPSSPWW